MYMPAIFGEDLFDNWMEDAMHGRSSNRTPRSYTPSDSSVMRTDICDTGDNYELEIELPGFKKDEVSIKLENGTMTVSAKKAAEAPKTGYVRKERWTGGCTRSFYVGDALRGEDVKARMENGILFITIPKEVKKVPENHTVIIEG